MIDFTTTKENNANINDSTSANASLPTKTASSVSTPAPTATRAEASQANGYISASSSLISPPQPLQQYASSSSSTAATAYPPAPSTSAPTDPSPSPIVSPPLSSSTAASSSTPHPSVSVSSSTPRQSMTPRGDILHTPTVEEQETYRRFVEAAREYAAGGTATGAESTRRRKKKHKERARQESRERSLEREYERDHRNRDRDRSRHRSHSRSSRRSIDALASGGGVGGKDVSAASLISEAIASERRRAARRKALREGLLAASGGASATDETEHGASELLPETLFPSLTSRERKLLYRWFSFTNRKTNDLYEQLSDAKATSEKTLHDLTQATSESFAVLAQEVFNLRRSNALLQQLQLEGRAAGAVSNPSGASSLATTTNLQSSTAPLLDANQLAATLRQLALQQGAPPQAQAQASTQATGSSTTARPFQLVSTSAAATPKSVTSEMTEDQHAAMSSSVSSDAFHSRDPSQVNSLTSAPATNADSGVPNGVDDTVMPPPIPLAQFTSSRPSSTSSSTYTSPNGRNSQSQPQSYQPQPYSHSRPDSSASSSSGMFSSPTINGPNPSMGQRGAPPQAMYAPNNGSNMNGTMNNMNYYGTPYSTAPNSNQSTPQQQQHQQRSAYPPNGAFNPYQQQASPPQQFPNNNQPSQSMPYYPSAPNSVGPMPSSTQNTPASSSARPSNSTDYLMQQLLHEQYLMHQQQQLANQYAQQRLRAPATTRAASRASTATNGRSRTASASRTTNGTPQATPAGMSAIAQQRLAMMQSALALTATPSSASTPALHLTPSNIATAPYGTPQTQPPPFRSSSLEPRNPRSGSASSRKTTPSRGNDSAYLSVLNHHAIKKYNQHSAPPPPKPHFHGLYNGTHTKNERRAF